MRLSSMQVNQRGIQQMQRVNEEVVRTQEQIASGRKVVRPSDDPIAASKLVVLRRDIAERESFIKNAEQVDHFLTQQENILDQVVDVVQRVQELVLQAANGALGAEDRQFISVEIESRLDELSSLMNARGSDGKYLFSGSLGEQQPFVVDGADVKYMGDEQQRFLQIDQGLSVAFSDSGRELFMDVPSARTSFTAENHPQNQATGVSIHSSGVVDAEALAEFAPEDVVVEFQPLADSDGEANFTVRRLRDNRIVEGMENVKFSIGAPFEVAGMSFYVDGNPEVGDRFVLRTTETQPLLTTVSGIARDLRNLDEAAEPEAFQAMVNDAISNLENAHTNILKSRSALGARLNSVSSTKAFHEEQKLSDEAQISRFRDLDYAEAVSQLSYQSFVLEAAQQSFARISRLSLFNAL